MKRLIFFVLLLIISAKAQIVKDSSGREIILLGNKTWDYLDEFKAKGKKQLKENQIKTEKFKGNGDWKVDYTVDAMNDKKIIFVSNYSGNTSRSPSLHIRCNNNSTELFLNTHEYMSGDRTDLKIRLDKNKPYIKYWNVSTNNSAVFYSYGTISFIKELLKHDTLTLQYRPYGENSRTISFNLKGLENAISTLRKSCSW